MRDRAEGKEGARRRPRVTAAQGSARVLALPLAATCRGLFTARVRDSHTVEPTPGPKPRPRRPWAPLLLPKLINSRLPPCQTLPLAPIPSNENLATVSPGSRFLSKQTNCPAAVPAPHPGAARDGPHSAFAATPRPLQPMEPGLWRPRPAPIAGRALLRPSPPPPPPPPRAFVDSSVGPAWRDPASSRRSSRGPQARRSPEHLGWG